jgi:hypothetical protein
VVPFEAVPQEPAEIPPDIHQAQMDFIRTYVGYADVLEVAQSMHEAVAVQIIASVLNKNGIHIPHGPLSYPLDLWIVLLSRSGAGRNTLITLADRLIEGANLGDLVRNTRWGSAPALYQQMAENPTALFVWGELSEKLKLLNDARFGGVKQWLTDRYDNFRVPECVGYRETQKSQNTPPITFATAPRMNILATSSAHWFFNNLTQEDSAGGFVPRWLIVCPDDPGKIIPTPLQPNWKMLERLIWQLIRIAEIKGEADLTDILPLYEEWYVETIRRFDSQPNAELANAYFNRHRVHILKLAVIYEVSRSLSLRPSEASWKRAARAAKRLEETIFSLLGTGMNKEGFAIRQMEDRIKKAGPDGLPLSELTRAFQHDNKPIRVQRLQTLLGGETVLAFQRQTAGRTAIILVHHNAVHDYLLRHPDDKQRFDI